MHVFGFTFHGGPRPGRVQINRTVLFVLLAIWVLSNRAWRYEQHAFHLFVSVNPAL
jgi:hypothetical protein